MPLLINRNEGLAPFAGQKVRLLATVVRDGRWRDGDRIRGTTLLTAVFVDGRFASSHTWLQDESLVWGGVPRGSRVEMDCRVEAFEIEEWTTGKRHTKYGLFQATNLRVLGPSIVIEDLCCLIELYGWNAVADGVAALHEETT